MEWGITLKALGKLQYRSSQQQLNQILSPCRIRIHDA